MENDQKVLSNQNFRKKLEVKEKQKHESKIDKKFTKNVCRVKK